MKIICPKCQYENQADASRIVCARCATIIEVKQDPGAGTGMDSNGRRQTARLPFVGNVGNSQPLNNPLNSQPNTPPPPPPPNRDVYATRVGDDFDDVLDIPRQPQSGFSPGNEPTTAFEDVFAMPNYDQPASYNFPPEERKPTAPIEGFPTGSSRQRSTQDYAQSPEPEFMGWPVLPENADDDQEQIGSFSSNRGALLARVALGVVVFGLLSFLAYYFLGDKIARRGEGHPTATSNDTASRSATTYPPAAVPSLESKSSEVKSPAPEKPKPAEASQQAAQQAANKPQTQSPAPTNSSSQKVDIEPKVSGKTGYTQPPKPITPATPAKGSLTIQVASFNDQAQANDRVARLRQVNVEARVVQAEVSGKTWYRVQIGGYKSREEAASQANQLKSKGAIQDFIITTVGK